MRLRIVTIFFASLVYIINDNWKNITLLRYCNFFFLEEHTRIIFPHHFNFAYGFQFRLPIHRHERSPFPGNSKRERTNFVFSVAEHSDRQSFKGATGKQEQERIFVDFFFSFLFSFLEIRLGKAVIASKRNG